MNTHVPQVETGSPSLCNIDLEHLYLQALLAVNSSADMVLLGDYERIMDTDKNGFA